MSNEHHAGTHHLKTGLAKLVGVVMAATFLFILPGCDTFGEQDRIITLREDIPFRFTFNTGTDNVQTGQLNDLLSNNQSIVDILEAQGFSMNDLRGVRVMSVELRLNRPVQERLGFLSQVILKLRTENQSDLEIADLSQFPATGTRVDMNARTTRNVASHVSRPTFRALLQFQPSTLMANSTYELDAIANLAIEVEGF